MGRVVGTEAVQGGVGMRGVGGGGWVWGQIRCGVRGEERCEGWCGGAGVRGCLSESVSGDDQAHGPRGMSHLAPSQYCAFLCLFHV